MARRSWLVCLVGFAGGAAGLSIVDRRALVARSAAAAAAAAASLSPRGARGAPATAEAVFSGGNAAFLQPWFEEIRYRGVAGVEVGRLEDDVETRALRVVYDPARCTYKQLLGAYWRHVDPTAAAQFPADDSERGAAFRPAVWVADAEERRLATESMRRLAASGVYGQKPFVAEIADARPFRAVPEDGQDFFRDAKAYEKALKRSGRSKFFEDTYKPVKTTACQGAVCGYVYFPCTDENGCLPVVTGRW